ncbi:restriction endonuclease [Crossiella sp. SN42]|uniref:restriction endonuclease n=1 Tax=Crossiella sp. SN42 TaxID=2944808 RepID=UPI00207C3505|nr:restriction endonuclease [Crossiella sp. SN42]MCO1574638.1 restriction endonuclease [Crossiella sp. SN42]
MTEQPGRPDTEPTLLPTPSLAPGEFEDFTERLLSAHRFCVDSVRKVIQVDRWGRRGDKQDGIDFAGAFSDGATAAWQCKRYWNLTPAQVRDAVAECAYVAHEYYLVCSGEASSPARAEIAKYPGWNLLDRRGLGRLLADLPLHKRRDVLDETWGKTERKRLLGVPGEDAFWSLSTFVEDRVNPETVLNDCGPHVGRQAELRELGSALDRTGLHPVVVLISGPGGRGKTRLLIEALEAFQVNHREVPVLLSSPGAYLDGAALGELPQVPAVVVVDDAHRDPEALTPLLTYVRNVPGTQLVLTSRPNGVRALHAQIATARFSVGQVHEIVVNELTKRDAKELVESLTTGLELPWAARQYFADQAVHSPYVAVVAANLIRRGELTGPLAVDIGLREQVLARYQELALDGVDNPARRLLAVYAALGSVSDDDPGLLAEIASFCKLDLATMLRLVEQLRGRGVLVTRQTGTQVTPDVLADDILERESAVGQHDTGFTRQLWLAFGARYSGRLITELAELDWRLGHRAGPAVFASVWDSVRTAIGQADLDGATQALDGIIGLTTTQPHLLINLLEDVRARADAEGSNHAAAERARYRLAELYGRCATSRPDLLETSLDALWALRRSDQRPVNRHAFHPERVFLDELANIGNLQEDSFPARIVDRVETWLSQPATNRDIDTPLFALNSLLSKDGHRTIQSSQLTLNFHLYNVNPSWARPIRDRIRRILHREAAGTDLRRAGAAVRLLGEAIRPPKGGFGYDPSDNEILAWEDDDLATIATFADVALSTGSPVIRRLIHLNLVWTADHALSLPLRHAALVLVTRLNGFGDDLAELVMGNGYSSSTLRTDPVPTVEELRDAELARTEQEANLDESQRQELRMRNIQHRIALKRAETAALTSQAADLLTEAGGPSKLVRELDDALRQLELADPARTAPPLLLRSFSGARPDLTGSLVREVTAHAPGPLDQQLPRLLVQWAQQSEDLFLRWLEGFDSFRHGAKKAVAEAYDIAGWANRTGVWREVYQMGMSDPDPELRDRFLLGTHPLLVADPASVATRLLDAGITARSTQRLLERASDYDGAVWGRNLDQAGAEAILILIDHCGFSDYAMLEIVGGIARTHPVLILDSLAAWSDAGHTMPYSAEGIAVAFDQHADVMASWLARAATQCPIRAAAVAGVVMCQGMTTNQARHLATVADALDSKKLIALTTALNPLDIWPLHHPDLARHIIRIARIADSATTETVRQQIATAMRPSQWSWIGSVSNELNRVRMVATEALTNDQDGELHIHIQETLDWIDAEISRLTARQEELDNG